MEIGVVDLAVPAEFTVTGGAAIGLIVPRSDLAALVPARMLRHGRILPRRSPVTTIFARHLTALAEAAPLLTRRDGLGLAAGTVDLLAAILGLGPAPAADDIRPDPVRLARRYIEQHLAREDLSPGDLVKALALSRSQLYRQFSGFGGVDRYIRGRRLRRALFDLADPRQAGRRIGDIAYHHGFADEAHFSRLFRTAFGLSPRAAREAIRRGEAGALATLLPRGDDDAALARWLAELGAV